jgi:uncharacterized protein YjbJ (UPF0337 family)
MFIEKCGAQRKSKDQQVGAHTIRRKAMNDDVFGGKWKKMRSPEKTWWGKLYSDDVQKVGGKYDKLIGLLRAKYGHNQNQAENKLNTRTK